VKICGGCTKGVPWGSCNSLLYLFPAAHQVADEQGRAPLVDEYQMNLIHNRIHQGLRPEASNKQAHALFFPSTTIGSPKYNTPLSGRTESIFKHNRIHQGLRPEEATTQAHRFLFFQHNLPTNWFCMQDAVQYSMQYEQCGRGCTDHRSTRSPFSIARLSLK